MKNKVLIISPYFGKLPTWYGLFMMTLERNPDFTWLLVTDTEIPSPRPPNLLAQSMTLPELNALCQQKLGFDPAISNGYKVCELKPAFGKIFEESLRGYTHWGYGDCDVLFGEIAAFFPDELLDCYDAFSSCRCAITGQFSLFRNDGPFRDPYRFIPDYAERVRGAAVQNLDEVATDEALAAQGCRILRRQLQIHDHGSDEWHQWAQQLELKEKGTLEGLFWEGGEAEWRDGRMWHAETGKEAMFYHFHYWKTQWKLPRYPYWPGAISRVAIRQSGLEVEFAAPLKKLHFFIGYRVPHWFQRQVARCVGLAQKIGKGIARRLVQR